MSTDQAVWKFPLKITDRQTVPMPVGAKILCAQIQQGELCLWAEVDTRCGNLAREIWIFGTGHPIRNAFSLRYIGTVQQFDGGLVWHVYERK